MPRVSSVRLVFKWLNKVAERINMDIARKKAGPKSIEEREDSIHRWFYILKPAGQVRRHLPS